MPISVMGTMTCAKSDAKAAWLGAAPPFSAARMVWSKKSDSVDIACSTNGIAMTSVTTPTMTPSMSRPKSRRHHSASTAPSGRIAPLLVRVGAGRRHPAALPLPRALLPLLGGLRPGAGVPGAAGDHAGGGPPDRGVAGGR